MKASELHEALEERLSDMYELHLDTDYNNGGYENWKKSKRYL